jgi:hypothetical protein
MNDFTIDQLIDAIEKNGLEKIQRNYLRYDNNGNISGGCAFGQAAVNLGVYSPVVLHESVGSEFDSFANRVVQLNDYTSFSLPEIAEKLRKEFSTIRNKTFIV